MSRQKITAKGELLNGAGFLTPAPRPEPLFVNGKKTEVLAYGHEMVVKLARDFAGELYDSMMRNDETWAVWKHFCTDVSRDAGLADLVRLATPHLLGDARATLARMLGEVRYAHLHPAIYDALLKDNLIRASDGLVPVRKHIEEAYQGGRP